VHHGITTSMFYIGEPASAENGYIANADSAWDEQWVEGYGGTDDPQHRRGWQPAGFTPKENPFYVALPYNDLDAAGNRKSSATTIYWYSQADSGQSLLKNRWLRICTDTACAYGQWEDVGPFGEDDISYVFGDARPTNTRGLGAGIDVSPAIDQYLRLHGSGTVAWQFVSTPPPGPWLDTVTHR
jgi:hypothetical protein